MKGLHRCLAWLVPGLAITAGPLAAQASSDDRWLRDCNRYTDEESRVRFCEVRHTGFRPASADLTIVPDENGGVSIEGWDRDSVAITLRIQAGAGSEADARALAQEAEVRASGSTIRVQSPDTRHRTYAVVNLVLQVPRNSGLTVATENGPLAVTAVHGTMDLQSQNGPVSLVRVSGDVRARVENGPLTVELDGATWNGKGLDAESVNGPVDLGVPDRYDAELETGTVNGPMQTSVPLVVTVKGRMRDRIHSTLGKGGPPVRVVTTNGPITIHRAGI